MDHTPPARPPVHILVVNDDEAVLRLFEDLLTEEGYRVTLDTFDRPTSQVLERIAREQPDLVILDHMFGGEALGWQLLQAMKMHRATAPIAVLVSTAAIHQAREMETHLSELGVEIVIKPFDIQNLIDAVARTLTRHASRQP